MSKQRGWRALSLERIPGMKRPSRVCLGTAPFGTGIERDAAFAVMDAFFEGGGNFIDTAHVYGAWAPDGAGASERTVGEWLRVRGVRDETVVGTKGAHPPLGDMSVGRCRPEDVEQDLAESLERLGTDRVDVYWLHRDDPRVPAGEIIDGLARFARQGRIRCYGASNWRPERIEEAQEWAEAHGVAPFVASQAAWSLADSRPGGGGTAIVDEPFQRWHCATGLTAVPYSSQGRGYFSEANAAWARAGFPGKPPTTPGLDSPVNRARLARATELAGRKGCTANQVALAYLMAQPFPVYPIIGTSTPDHAVEALGATAVSLSEEERDWLTAS